MRCIFENGCTFSQKREMSFILKALEYLLRKRILIFISVFILNKMPNQGYMFSLFRPFEQSPDRLLVTHQAAKFHQKLSTNAY